MPTISHGKIKEGTNLAEFTASTIQYRQPPFEPMHAKVKKTEKPDQFEVEITPGCFGPDKITATTERPVTIYIAGQSSYLRVDLP